MSHLKLAALAALAGGACLCGCVQHLPASLPPAQLGTTDSIPLEATTGSAHSLHFFNWKRYGDDTTEAAIRDAKRGNQDLDLINIIVNRRVLCFPACDAALVTWSETTATGTLVRYKRMPEWEKPKAPPVAKLELGKAPAIEALLERLMHSYLQDPKEGAEFYGSLDNDTHRELIDFVLSKKGLTSTQGWTFRVPRGTEPGEKKFLDWFVATYTTYQPLDD